MPIRVSSPRCRGLELGVAALLSVLTVVSCRAMLRYPREGVEPGRDPIGATIAAADPLVLTDLVSDELVFEVDWIEGCRPRAKALLGLERRAREQTAPDRSVRIVLDDEVPLADWDAAAADDETPIVARWLDRTGPETIYVLFVPESRDGEFGLSRSWTFRRSETWVHAKGVVLFRKNIDDQAILWIRPANIERSTLIHEYGHVLGLSVNPEHTQAGNPSHCANPQCVMTHPQLRSILYHAIPGFFAGRLPTQYCRACRRDLDLARASFEPDAGSPVLAERLSRPNDTRTAFHAATVMLDDDRAGALGMAARAQRLAAEDDWATPFSVGWFYAQAGEPDMAVAAFEECEIRLPDGNGFLQIARIESAQGHWETALARLDEAESRRMMDVDLRSTALECTGQVDAALAAWAPVTELDIPWWRSTAAVERAAILRRAGRNDEALAVLEEIEGTDDGLESVRLYELGRILTAQGDGAAAEIAFRHAVAAATRGLEEGRRDDETAYRLATVDAAARAHARLGEVEEARELMETLGPEWPESYYGRYTRVAVLALTGRLDDGVALLSDIIGRGLTVQASRILDDDLAPLLDDPRLAERLPACPRGRGRD